MRNDWDDDDGFASRGWNSGRDRHSGGDGKPGDVGDKLKEKVGVSDDGKLQVFGKEFDVGGREIAFFLRPVVDTGLAWLALNGASKAGQIGAGIAEKVKLPANHAGKVGKGFYYLWLFGLSGADVALGIKKTVQDGFKDMHDLREQAQPLLCANNDKDVSMGKALTSKNTVLAHARAKIYSDFKHNLWGTMASTVRVLPMLLMGYHQAKLDDIKNPERVWKAGYREGMPKEREDALTAEVEDLRKRQLSKDFSKQEAKKIEELREKHLFPPLREGASSEEIEDRKLTGRYRVSDKWQPKRQEELIEKLRDLRSDERPDIRLERKILDELSNLRERAAKEVRQEVHTLRRARSEQRRNLDDVGTGGGKANENPVMEMFSWLTDSKARKRIFSPIKNDNYGVDYKRNIQNLMAAPAVASVVGDIVDRKISGKEAPDTAWDKIIDLQTALERHPHDPDHDIVAAKVKGIFKQYVDDIGRNYSLKGASFDRAAEAITDALINEKLHPQAMAEILDNPKIVVFGKDDADFGDAQDIKGQLGILVNKWKGKVGEKEVYKNAPFTPETLAATFKEIPEEEKPFFTMLFPPGVLEKVGVPKEEVEKYRDQGREQFVETLTDMTRALIEMKRGDLKNQGIKSKQIDALEAIGKDFRSAEEQGSTAEYIRDNMRDVTKVVRNVAASAKKPGELWKEFVERKDAPHHDDLAPKSPVDHATRDTGDEMHLG